VFNVEDEKHFVVRTAEMVDGYEAHLILARDESVAAKGEGLHHQEAMKDLEEEIRREYLRMKMRCGQMFH